MGSLRFGNKYKILELIWDTYMLFLAFSLLLVAKPKNLLYYVVANRACCLLNREKGTK